MRPKLVLVCLLGLGFDPEGAVAGAKVVKWDEATTDEMGIGFLMILKKDTGPDSPRRAEPDLWKFIKESGGVPFFSRVSPSGE